MKTLSIQPNLSEQVHDAILLEISSGKLSPGTRVIQEQIAAELGVSRQPVQQALMLLRNQGLLTDAPGRGLIVAPLDPVYIRQMYEIRSVLEGLAFRKAAEMNPTLAAAKGGVYIDKGRAAVKSGAVSDLVNADMAFHNFVYGLSENRLIAPTMDTHWTYTQRVMGWVLMRHEKQRDIWDQHEAMLQSIAQGDGDSAEQAARKHILQASDFIFQHINEH
ncbi:MAG: GntR family transcriptional regulator [Betaproteobacteria bacterium]|nr:GntR family transcriptional regulator [Betaproteobacteria bacterium]